MNIPQNIIIHPPRQPELAYLAESLSKNFINSSLKLRNQSVYTD